jgi:hypothetical protein
MPEFIFLAHNMITRFGKRYFTNMVAGNVTSLGKDVAIGIGSTAASIDDTRLDFEWYRLPVSYGSTDIQTVNGVTTYSVIYKTTLPQNIAGTISEIGLYPSSRASINEADSKFISDFTDNLTWTDEVNQNPDIESNTDLVTYSKIGNSVLKMIAGTNDPTEYTNSESVLNLSGYSTADSISLAYYKYDANLSSIKIRLYTSDSAYYQYTVTPPSGTGYKLQADIPLSDVFLNPVGSPNLASISKIGFLITPTTGNSTAVGMDGFRINDEDTFDPEFGIISRSVLSSPIIKLAGRQIDLEYKLDLGYGS